MPAHKQDPDKNELRSLTKEELLDELGYKLITKKWETAHIIVEVLFEKKFVKKEVRDLLMRYVDKLSNVQAPHAILKNHVWNDVKNLLNKKHDNVTQKKPRRRQLPKEPFIFNDDDKRILRDLKINPDKIFHKKEPE